MYDRDVSGSTPGVHCVLLDELGAYEQALVSAFRRGTELRNYLYKEFAALIP